MPLKELPKTEYYRYTVLLVNSNAFSNFTHQRVTDSFNALVTFCAVHVFSSFKLLEFSYSLIKGHRKNRGKDSYRSQVFDLSI